MRRASGRHRRRTSRWRSWTGRVVVLALVTTSLSVLAPTADREAQAQEQNTANLTISSATSPSTAVQTQPSGLALSYAIGTGSSSSVAVSQATMASRGGGNELFEPNLNLTSNALQLSPDFGSGSGGAACAKPASNGTSLCFNRGTVTLSFSTPVTDPVLHLTGIGGQASGSGNYLIYSAAPRLTGSSPSGASFGRVTAGTNLVTDGTTTGVSNYRAGTACNASSAATGGTTAGCGSVTVPGTWSSLTFALDMRAACVGTCTNITNAGQDAFAMVVTTAQDFGDAPTTYNGSQAPAHAMGDLKLGGTVDADDTTDANSTTSPFPVNAGSSANGTNGDGADEDAFTTLPDVIAQGTAPYTLTVPVSGASRAGTVAGWIDLDRNGTFEASERASATFAAGASSAQLSFAKPAGLTPGVTYARFRTAYAASDVANPTGLAASGEVEDYSLSIVNENPAVTLTKTAGAVADTNGSGRQDAGDTVPYTFTVRNSGDSPLSGISIADPKISGVTCQATSLAPGASTTCSGSYTLTQADVDAGTVANTATVSAQSAGQQTVTASSSTTRSVTRAPAVSLTKTAGTLNDLDGNGPDVGDTIPYTFTVTNTGTVTSTSQSISDPKLTASCPAGSLAPGASKTCTGTYVLTQADVDAGQVVNTATVSAVTAAGTATASASATRTFTPTSRFTFAKQAAGVTDANASSRQDAGDTIAYSFVFTNTGTTTLSAPAVSDAKTGPVTCPAGPIAPGASLTCTKTYTLTQSDVDSGAVNNTATGSVSAPTGMTSPAPQSSALSTAVTPSNVLTLAKSASPVATGADGRADAGDTITYTFTITNSGSQTLSAPAVNDPKVGPVTCPSGSLAPGASATCTKTYALTQADVDAGSVRNTASATATQPGGTAVTSATASATTTVTAASSISLDKVAGPAVDANTSGRTDAGDTIRYTFTITNTGNTTLDPTTVTDPKTGPVTCPTTALAPGRSVDCTPRVYTITQADADAGTVNNTATATGRPPTGAAVTGADSTSTAVPPVSTLAVTKAAGTLNDLDANGPDVGDTLPYTFTVRNTGTTTLSQVAVDDPKIAGVSCSPTTLGSGATATCSATYTLTQADVDAGRVVNTATATGRSPGGATVSGTASSTKTFTPLSRFAFDKQAGDVAVGSNGRADAGETITYSFVLTNTGATTLSAPAVGDAKTGPVTCPTGTIAPGASVTCTKTYTLTQADVDSGAVNNTATASAQPPAGLAAPDPQSDSTSTALAAAGALALTKTAGPVATGADGRADAGDTVTYTFTLTNQSNQTLTNPAVSDPKVGPVTCPAGSLAPGATTSCTTTYALTQADVDAGTLTNTATATARTPQGTTTTSAPASATTTIVAAPSISLDKVAGPVVDANTSGRTDAGDTIRYTFSITNTGNTTLDPTTVTDPKTGPVTCPTTALGPGRSTDCTPRTYSLTQNDLDAGAVNNTATATGRPPSGPAVTSADSTSTTLTTTGTLTLTKTAGALTDPDGNGPDAGDAIPYTLTATNTGTTTLSQVTVTDPKLPGLSCSPATIGPGASTTCTGSYTLTQADVDAGRVVNTATATARTPRDQQVTATASATKTYTATSSLAFDKQAGPVVDVDKDGRQNAGDTITYSFVLTNTGTTTLSAPAVSDAKTGPVTCPAGAIAPGESATCTKTYTLTQADNDAGAVNNTATGSAQAPAGQPAPAAQSDSTSTALAALNQLVLTKSAGAVTDANATGRPDAGDTIRYTFTVTNPGSQTLSLLSISDPKVGLVTCPQTTVRPGTPVTCTATYTLTQADLDAGGVPNSATATASGPQGARVTSNLASTTTSVTRLPSLTFDKQAAPPVDVDGNGRTNAGDTIRYTFSVTNTGNVTLDPVTVADPKTGPVTCPAGGLSPGRSVDCTPRVYTITQADVDAGAVNNTATASGRSPDATTVRATDDTSTPTSTASSIDLTKTAGALLDTDGNGPDAGDSLPYVFTVRNTGDTTVTALTIDDPALNGSTATCSPTSVAPGGRVTCSGGSHVLSQADVDAGRVVNTATARGTSALGGPVSDTDSVTTPVTPVPAFTLDKQAGPIVDANGDGLDDAGDTITYTFVLTNTGSTTLSNPRVTDSRTGPVTCPTAAVPPGGQTSCEATYTLTQRVVDAGAVNNTATATMTSTVGGTPPTQSDSTSTVVPETNTLELDKIAGPVVDANDSRRQDAGDTIDYRFTVTNTGNQTLSDIAVDDERTGPVTCPGGSLAPRSSVDCTVRYTLTRADLDTGTVVNTALASAQPPRTGATRVESNQDTTRTDLTAAPSVELDKSASTVSAGPDQRVGAGDTITYSFTVTNTGNQSLDPVTVTDPLLPGGVTCPAGPLAAGASATCTDRTYVLTQDDVDAGAVNNTATVRGQSPIGTSVQGSDSTSTVVAGESRLSTLKTAGPLSDADGNGPDAGDSLTYAFRLTNTGTTTLSVVSVTDPQLGGTFACSPTVLRPGQVSTCEASYTLTQADVDAGQVVNRATGSATDPFGVRITDDATATKTFVPTSAFAFDKQVAPLDLGPNDRPDAGDTLDYTFVLTNTGATTLAAPRVSDPKVGPVTCPAGEVVPGASVSCTKQYVVTQDDVDAGTVDNTATAQMSAPVGRPQPESRQDSTSTAIATSPALTLTKTAEPYDDANDNGRADAGETVDYTFAVTNTGNTTLSGLAVGDPRLTDAPVCRTTTLLPGAGTSCEATYTLTQGDVDAGRVVNTATATATDPRGATVTSPESSTTTRLAARPSVVLDKQASAVATGDDGRVDAGDTITYSFTVTNTGNVTLDPVTVADPTTGTVSCPTGALAPGRSAECDPVVYRLTQTDVDSGAAANTATATGTSPTGVEVTGSDSTSRALTAAGAVVLDKQADPVVDADGDGADSAGDTITYTFTVTNTGNVTASGLTLTDPLLGGTLACTPDRIAPGASTSCGPVTYTLTQDDLENGRVDNTADLSATTPGGTRLTSSDTTRTTLTRSPALTLDKQASPVATGDDGRVDAGDTVTYSFTLTNTGNVTLDPVTVTDPLLPDGVTCPTGSLAPGESTDCEDVTYTLTQDDVDAGALTNTATATGRPRTGDPVTATDTTSTDLTRTPALELVKSAAPYDDANDNGRADAGETITYTFAVTNTGNTTLTGLAIDDPQLTDAPTCRTTTLRPGADTECEATYTLTQDDLDAGTVENTATASASDPTGTTRTSPESTTTSRLAERPAVALVKRVTGSDLGADARVGEGDTLTYSFTLTNTGNVTLDPVTVDDPLLPDGVTCPTGPLAPGESTDCDDATYTLTQDDVDAGALANTATASGTSPAGTRAGASSTVTTDLDRIATLSLDKSAAAYDDANDNGRPDAGETITYTFAVTNTGNTTLSGLAVDDPQLTDAPTCRTTTLRPGADTECEATYTLTQDDVDAGTVENTATAGGTGPDGLVATSAPATATSDLPARATVLLDKSAGEVTQRDPDRVTAGDAITYSFTITNTGNVTLDPVTVDDPLLPDGVTCPTGPLAPGESTDCDDVTYELTQDDVDAGTVQNTATATASAPGGDRTTGEDSTSTDLSRAPSLSLDKTAGEVDLGADDRADAGDTVTYSFRVTNTGNVRLRPVTVDDPKVGAVTCPTAALEPGDSVACDDVTYELTQDDVDAGTVENTATASGTAPDGSVVTGSDSTSTTLAARPGIALDKSGEYVDSDGDGLRGAGDTIRYTFTITNTGNRTLREIELTDPMLGGAMSCPRDALAPGRSLVCGPVDYTLTQADVDAGAVANRAEASAEGASRAVAAGDRTSTPLAGVPALTLEKTATLLDRDGDGRADRGETVRYGFEVTNTGNVSLEGVVVDDPMLRAAGEPVRCTGSTLAPGASLTCTAEHRVTAAEEAAGVLINRAGATADSPAGRASAPTAEASVPTAGAPDGGSGGGPGGDGTGGGLAGLLPDTGTPQGLALTGLAALLLIGAGAVILRLRRRD